MYNFDIRYMKKLRGDFMKKKLARIMACVLLITSFFCLDAFSREDGFAIEFNGEETGCVSVILNNTHYVPMRAIFD